MLVPLLSHDLEAFACLTSHTTKLRRTQLSPSACIQSSMGSCWSPASTHLWGKYRMTDRRLYWGLLQVSQQWKVRLTGGVLERWEALQACPVSPWQFSEVGGDPSPANSQACSETEKKRSISSHGSLAGSGYSPASPQRPSSSPAGPGLKCCPAPSNFHSASGMALQDVCKWQAPDTHGPSLRLPQAGGWAVPRGCDPQTFLQIYGPRLAHGTTTLAFRFRHGVIAAADTRSSCGSYVACPASRKVIPVHRHLLGTTSGTSADCATWYRVLRRELRLRELREGQLPSVAGTAKLLSAMMSRYRGLDLCVATALCGWDHSGPALFYVYSDGTCLQGDVFSVGSGSPYAYGVLDRSYHYDMTVQEAYTLARCAVAHATHRDAYSGGSVDLFHVRESGWEYISRSDACVLYRELQEAQGFEQELEAKASEVLPEPATPQDARESELSVELEEVTPEDCKIIVKTETM